MAETRKQQMIKRLVDLAVRATATSDAVWKEPLTVEQLRKYVKDTNDHISNLALETANALDWCKQLTLQEFHEETH